MLKMTQRAIPVILCGRSSTMAKTVTQGLLPEIDVRHVILGPEEGIKQLPQLLSQTRLHLSNSNNEYQDSERLVAVITGAAYNDDEVLQMQAGCAQEALAGVYWLRAGQRSDMPPPGPAYGQRMAQRVKELMARLAEEGKLGKAKAGEQVEF